MKWFTLYDTATGKRLDHTTVPPQSVPKGVTQVEHSERRDQGDFVWNEATKQWDTAPPNRIIPIPQLIERLTEAERIQFYLKLGQGNPSCIAVEKAIDFAHGKLGHKADLDDPATAQIVGLLAQGGVITAERIPEILA